jgi:hypothetical protein
MFSLLKGFYDAWHEQPELSLLIIGPQNAGKSVTGPHSMPHLIIDISLLDTLGSSCCHL